jgi:hypothetical protein
MRIAISLAVLCVLNLAELLIHVIYGWQCWGFQPVGRVNMLIIVGLSVLFATTALLSLLSAGNRSRFLLRAGVAAAGLAISVAAFGTVGWRLFTSIHHQGAENLVFVGALNAGTIAVAVAAMAQPDPRMQRDATVNGDGGDESE